MGDAREAPALEVRGVSKRYGAVEALRGVDLTVWPGTVHALVGENGAGKSTLLGVLSGGTRPDGGEMRLGGAPYAPRRPADALRAGVAMIHQELSLAPDLTVAENVCMGVEPRGRLPLTVDLGAMEERIRSLARKHGLSADPRALVRDLSAADCQVVEVLKALARRARVIAFDEPTSSLGRKEADALLQAVRRLRDKGKAIVYISHRLEEVMGLADDLTVLRDGEVARTGPAAGVDVAEVVRLMVGRELGDYYPPRRARPGAVRLEVRDLGTDERVSGVSFEVRGGEVVGLGGLVGAGRTALLRALFGLAPRREGSVRFDGRELALRSPREALAAGFAYVTEDRKRTGLCLDLPSAWNVTLPCLDRLGGGPLLRPSKERAVVEGLGERLRIRWPGPEAPASALSGGNQQKLLFGRVLLGDAQLVLLDEPTRGVDVGARADVYRLVDELAAAGRAVLLASSELPELLGVTDRILVMRRGRLVGEVDPASADQEAVMRLAAVEGGNP